MKEEPTHYNFDQFVAEKTTKWSGVKNALAQKHLQAMNKGDPVLYYHTGNEKAVVGTARVTSEPAPDPADASGKLFLVELTADERLGKAVTLAAIKADRRFADFALVRLPRLSVMPVSEEQWAWIIEMSEN